MKQPLYHTPFLELKTEKFSMLPHIEDGFRDLLDLGIKETNGLAFRCSWKRYKGPFIGLSANQTVACRFDKCNSLN